MTTPPDVPKESNEERREETTLDAGKPVVVQVPAGATKNNASVAIGVENTAATSREATAKPDHPICGQKPAASVGVFPPERANEIEEILPLPPPITFPLTNQALPPGAYAEGGNNEESQNSAANHPGITDVLHSSNDAERNHEAVSNHQNNARDEEDNYGLVEATILSNTPTPVIMAVNEDEIKRRRAIERSLRRQRDACALLAVLGILLAIILGLILGLKVGQSNSTEEEGTEVAQGVLPVETWTPSAPPSLVAPSEAPSQAFDAFLEQLPDFTTVSLQNATSPQSLAFQWLHEYPNVTLLEDWRITQLFALATFFYAFEGPKWRQEIREDWLVMDKHECFWYSAHFGMFEDDGSYIGVSNASAILFNGSPCNPRGELVVLSVSDLGLAGTQPVIPPELSLMTSLKEIHGFFNDISTPLQSMIPSQLYTAMPQLRIINFLMNSLSGSIPTEMGLISDLKWLAFDFNIFLTGTLPSELGLLTKLTRLSLSVNSLSSTIPSELGGMTSLVALDLDSLSLTGAIPREIGWLSNLEGLGLNNNALSSSLPTELGLLTKLYWSFNLYRNALTGSIPSHFGQFTNLQSFKVHDNFLSGSLPSEIGLLATLEYLDVGSNQLSGSLPSRLGLLTGLKWLECADNSLSSAIPSEIAGLTSLERLDLASNQLRDALPSTLGLLAKLEWMDLSSNVLSSVLPGELGMLDSLKELFLDSNQFTGSVPFDWSGMTALRVLGLSDLPLLSGSLPVELGWMASMYNLSWLNMSATSNLHGVLPEDLCHLANNEACNYTLSGSPFENPKDCVLEFDCTESLCGCDCNCTAVV